MQVSAIIPTMGTRSDMLARAVAAVLGQRRPVDDLLVVVDGDRAMHARVERDLAGRARVVTTGRRSGVSAARNLGARTAAPGLLAFLDDDDVWKPAYLERILGPGTDLDVALTAFEKHTPDAIRPEKIPPPRLERDAFLVANPGLRGSNLVIHTALYQRIGGFDESLPAFNDLDFGVRLADARPRRYLRIVEPLVEFHSHRGARLSTPGCEANRIGMKRYWLRYRDAMSHDQRRAFRSRALRLWGLDPEALA